MIVDSTRKGKRFPDSMSKTIPVWTCVLNRAISNYRNRCFSSSQDTVSKKFLYLFYKFVQFLIYHYYCLFVGIKVVIMQDWFLECVCV